MTTVKLSEKTILSIESDGVTMIESGGPHGAVTYLTRDETEALRLALNEADDTRNQKTMNHTDIGWAVLTDIGWAVLNLRNGNKIRRPGWHNKTGFLKLQIPDENSNMTEPYVYMEFPSTDDLRPVYRIPWLCSQADMLATDWELVP